MSPDLELALPKRGQNNVWYRYTESDEVIVFVHGIFSDSRGCWLYQDGAHPERTVYWPALVASDVRFGNVAIYLAGYYTAIDAGPYEVRNCADEIFRALQRPDPDGIPGPLAKPTLVFVCHSTGGVVVRYLLEANQASFAGKRIGLVLIASPSYGASWADRLDWLAKFYNQQLGIQIEWGSWALRDLDARFRNLIDSGRLSIRGVEAYENHFVFHRSWLPDRKLVVTEASAGRYFGAPVLLRNTNHFTAVKPDSKSHPAHELLVDFWGRLGHKRATKKPIVRPQRAARQKLRRQNVRHRKSAARVVRRSGMLRHGAAARSREIVHVVAPASTRHHAERRMCNSRELTPVGNKARAACEGSAVRRGPCY